MARRTQGPPLPVVNNLFVGRDLKFVLSNNHYEEAFYKYRKDKPIEYVVEKYGGDWLIIDDSSMVKRYNGDKCYKIKPFCICYDDTYAFREEALQYDASQKVPVFIRIQARRA